MKKIIIKVITLITILLSTFSLTTITALATEPTEAPTDIQTEAATEALTAAPTSAPTEQNTEAPTEEKGTPITAGMVLSVSNDILKFINRHKETILSGASALASLLLSAIVTKMFKPKLKEFSDKSTASINEIKSAFEDWKKEQNEKVDEMSRVLAEFKDSTKNMIESYEKERADLHAADATAEINHELATMIHQLIMQSKVGMNIKDQADKVFTESEEKIQKIMEEAKKERGEHHGGEHQGTNG